MGRRELSGKVHKLIYFSVFMYALVICFSNYNEVRGFLRVAFVLGVVNWFLNKPQVAINTKHMQFLGMFFLTLFFSMLVSPFHMTYNENYSYFNNNYLNPLTSLLVVTLFVQKKEWVKKLFIGLAISFIINNIYGTYQFYLGEIRVAGLTEHIMSMAGVLIILFLTMLTIALNKNFYPKYRWLFVFSIIVSIPVIYFNGTRAVWITLVLLMPVLFFQLHNRKGIVYFCIVLVLAGSGMFQVHQARERFFTITDMQSQSNAERVLMWQSAWNMFKDYPVTGVGLGHYKSLYFEKYISPQEVLRLGHAHNVPLQILAETGIIGFLGYITFFGYVLLESIRHWRRRADILGLMMFTITAGFLMQGFTEMNLGNQLGITRLYWFIFGMYLVLTDAIVCRNTEKIRSNP